VDAALARDLRRWAGGRPLVCTAKDRVRLPPDLAADVWWRDAWIEVEGPLPDAWFPVRAGPG
jgi:tetraacyldisaccharide-1-P 4'-kinase